MKSNVSYLQIIELKQDTRRLNQNVEIKTKVCNVFMWKLLWDQCLINVINHKSPKCHVEAPEPNASYYEFVLCGNL